MIKPEKAVEVLKGDFTNIKLGENESHSDIFTQALADIRGDQNED